MVDSTSKSNKVISLFPSDTSDSIRRTGGGGDGGNEGQRIEILEYEVSEIKVFLKNINDKLTVIEKRTNHYKNSVSHEKFFIWLGSALLCLGGVLVSAYVFVTPLMISNYYNTNTKLLESIDEKISKISREGDYRPQTEHLEIKKR